MDTIFKFFRKNKNPFGDPSDFYITAPDNRNENDDRHEFNNEHYYSYGLNDQEPKEILSLCEKSPSLFNGINILQAHIYGEGLNVKKYNHLLWRVIRELLLYNMCFIRVNKQQKIPMYQVLPCVTTRMGYKDDNGRVNFIYNWVREDQIGDMTVVKDYELYENKRVEKNLFVYVIKLDDKPYYSRSTILTLKSHALTEINEIERLAHLSTHKVDATLLVEFQRTGDDVKDKQIENAIVQRVNQGAFRDGTIVIPNEYALTDKGLIRVTPISMGSNFEEKKDIITFSSDRIYKTLGIPSAFYTEATKGGVEITSSEALRVHIIRFNEYLKQIQEVINNALKTITQDDSLKIIPMSIEDYNTRKENAS